MQFHPAYGTECPLFGPFHPHSNCNQTYMCPNVVGEGEVVSVIFPDGSLHFYFLPIRRYSELNYAATIPNYNPFWNSHTGAFYVRRISNPVSPAAFQQHIQLMNGLQSKAIPNYPTSGFQLKFHNDSWSSTTDLHYFVPRALRSELYIQPQRKDSTAVQVNIPPNICGQIVCAKPCLCSKNKQKCIKLNDINMIDYCECKMNNKHSVTSLSSKDSKECMDKKRSKLNLKNEKKTPKKTSFTIDCKPNTTEKGVTTYTDQSSCCVGEENRNTQTEKNKDSSKDIQRRRTKGCGSRCSGKNSNTSGRRCCSCSEKQGRKTRTHCGTSTPIPNNDSKTELWLARSMSNCKSEDDKSERVIGICDSFNASASESCCCSLSGTDILYVK